MFARRTFKTLISLLLVTAMVSGIFPFEPLVTAVAYAQSFSVTNPGDYSWTLEEAESMGDDAVQTLGEWRYVVLPESNYAVIVGHTYTAATEIYVPEVLNGADVVGIAANVFTAHGDLESVTMPGNIYAIGKNALPKGVVIRGYNASYSLTYASKNRFPFENISEYDFRSGVVDYADIRVGNFERVSENLVRLRTLEASRLSEGKRFFLVDPMNPYAISYYTAQTISQPDENGFVTIVCDTPEIDDLFYSYNLEDQIMVVDPNSVVLYNGTTLESTQSSDERWIISASPELKFGITCDIPIPRTNSTFSVAGTYDVAYKLTASGGLFRDEEMVIEESSGLAMTFKYTHKFLEADDNIKDTSLSVDELRSRITQMQRNHGTLTSTTAEKRTLTLGKAVVFSWAGIVNITMTYGLDYEISGNISVSISNKSVTTYTYKDGNLTSKATAKKKTIDASIEASAKAGISASLEVYITFVPLFSVELFLGVEGTAKMEYSYAPETGEFTTLNMLDTISIEVAIILEITLKLVVVEVASFKFTLHTLPPFHLHLFPFTYSSYPDEFGNYSKIGLKHQWHFAIDCPYDVKTASFVFPWLNESDDDYTYTQVKELFIGTKLPEPQKPNLYAHDRFFLGWHTNETLSSSSAVNWPYTIKDNVTFYANSAILRDVKFVYTDESPVAPALERIKGDIVILPEGDGSHEIVAWALVDKNLTIIRNLPEGAATYTMPDEDVILCALCPDDIRINYHTGIGADVREFYAPRNTTYPLQTAESLEITDRARFDFAGWTDLEGNPYEESIFLDKNTPAIIDIYANWVYNPEKLTTQALTESDFGSWSTEDNNSEPTYSSSKYYNYSPNPDGTLTISGFITAQKVDDGNGGYTTIYVSPTNLKIPSSIYIESEKQSRTVSAIGARAFDNLDTLLEVTLPNTVTRIGEGAFENSKNLKLIDLQSAPGVTTLPATFANGCTSLKCVLLPDTIDTIGSNAFYNCSSLTSVNLNAKSIGNAAFYGCSSLATVRMGQVTSLGSSVFANCLALTSLIIPDTVTSLGNSCFSGCTNLKKLTFDGAPRALSSSQLNIGSGSLLEEVVIGDGVITLGANAFSNSSYGFPHLRKISLPSSLILLSEYALKNTAVEELELYSHLLTLGTFSFSGCAKLKKVTVHGGMIHERAFSGCTALEEVILGNGVVSIGNSAFSGCTGLKSVTMGKNILSVGSAAFSGCTSLTSLTFPDSVTSYGSNIISGCSSLTDLHIGGGCKTLTSSMFKIGETNTLRTLSISNGVTTIDSEAFYNGNFGFTSLETVSIPASVTSIGSRAFSKAGMHTLILGGAVDLQSSAFSNCPNLKNIVVEGNIADSAFANCTALTTLTLRGKDTTVGNSAFSGCTNLTNVTIEEGVKHIGAFAFQNCAKIKTLVFPDSVTSYGTGLLMGCTALEELTVGGGAKRFAMSGEGNYYTGYSAFYIGPDAALKRLVIREGVKELGEYAFANRSDTSSLLATHGYPNLESVVLPESLKLVGDYAFFKAGMSSLSLPGSPAIGNYAFANCTNLKAVTLNASVGNYAFQNCSSLETVTVKRGCSSIGSSAFSCCTNLSNVTFEEGVKKIGSFAFQNCRSLKTLVFPDSVTSYGGGLLSGCTALEELTVGGGCSRLAMSSEGNYYSGYSPFYIGSNAALKHLVIREGVEELGEYAFANRIDTSSLFNTYGYPKLESVILPESLLRIGAYAFRTPALKSLSIPENVTSIGYQAFENSTSLETLVLRGDNLSVGTNAFAGCTNLTNVTIEEGAKRIEAFAFQNCAKIKTLVFPDSVTSYGTGLLMGCTGLEELTVGGGVSTLAMSSEGSYYTGYSAFYIGPDAALKRLVIREGVEELHEYAFANRIDTSTLFNTYGYPKLESVILPESLKLVGNYAFYKAGMSSLTLLGSPAMGNYAFADCTNLKAVTLNADAGNYAFQNCTSLESVTIRSGCSSIGSSAFSGCTNLTNVTFEEGVKKIGSFAFQNCRSLKTLVFPDSVTSYGGGLLSGCTALEELTVGGGVSTLAMSSAGSSYSGYSPFYIGSNAALKHLVIREGVEELGEYAFANRIDTSTLFNTYGYPKLESVILPESLLRIGAYAFRTPALKSLSIPENVTSIGYQAFENSTSLETLVLRGDNLSVGTNAFAGCINLTNVTIEEGVQTFNSGVFYNCRSIKTLAFPDSVTFYGASLLQGCTALEELTVGGGVSSLSMSSPNLSYRGYSAFYIGPNAGLKRLVIREGVKELGEYAFANRIETITSYGTYGYPHLESVVLPESLTVIHNYNLQYWKNLSHLRLSSNLSRIANSSALSGITLYTDAYNEVVNKFALQKSLTYEVRDESTYPTFTLYRVTNAASADTLPDDGFNITTGTTGEEITLPEGYGVLSCEAVAYGDALPAFEDPVAEGYVFGGWYVDAAFTSPWVGGPMPSCTLTLYAHMLPISRVAFALGIADAGTPDAALPEGFSLHSETTAVYLDSVVPPTPEVPGRIFVGWYKDAAFTQEWSVLFDCMPAEALTLYGKFVPQYTAQFALNLPAGASFQGNDIADGFTLYDSFLVNEGDRFYGPEEPVVTGYVFSGWFEEPTFEHPWSSQTMPEGGATIYGRLERITAGGQYAAIENGLQLKSYVLEQDQSSEVYLPSKIDGQKVTDIASRAFSKDEITFLHLPEYLEGFHPDAFDDMRSLRAFDISANNASFATKNGVLYSRDMTILYRYPQGKTSRTFTVPATVVSIAPYAFENCVNLRTINLPAGLTDIGEFAFSGCTKLSGIAIPDGVTALKEGTFHQCNNLIRFSAYGLTSIAAGTNITPAFTLNSGLEVSGPLAQGALRDFCSATVNGERVLLVPYNMHTVSLYVDGVLSETLRNEAGLPLNSELFGITLPDGTLVLDWYRDSSFTQVWNAESDVMPDTTLSLYATRTKLFSYESIQITGDDGTAISGLMLTSYNGKAKDLVIPERLDGTPVIALGESFLSGMTTKLYTLEIGSHICAIADTALTAVSYPFSGTIIADADSYAAAWAETHGYDWEALTYTVSFEADGCVIPSISGAKGTELLLPTPKKIGVTFTGWYMDTALSTPAPLNEDGFFELPGMNLCLYAAWDGTFEDVPFTYSMQGGGVTITGYTGNDYAVTIPETINGLYVTAIGESAFEGCATLHKIVLPDSVWSIGKNAFAHSALIGADLGSTASIGESAFADCTQLANLSMDSVSDIAAHAFSNCTSLRTLDLPESLYRIDSFAFSGCTGLSEIVLPDGFDHLADSAFDACRNLETIHIGSGASFIHPNAFSGCTKLRTFTVSSENPFYLAQNGVLFSADKTQLVRYPAAKADTAYTLPKGTLSIGEYAFAQAVALEQVALPTTLTEIGENAFRNCAVLTRFELPEGAKVSTIAKNAFLGCSAFTQVVLNTHVTKIEDGAFMNCPLLETIVLPSSVTDISTLAFSSADKLKIVGSTGSTAHAYALANNIPFTDPNAIEVETLTLNAERTVLNRGETLDLILTFEPAASAEYTDIRWMTTDSSVAIVTDGTLRGIGGGTATIFAIAGNGVQAELTFEIQVPVTNVTLSEIPTLARGDVFAATASLLPLTATDTILTWESSDDTVFTVDQSGNITAIEAGEALLTVTAHNGICAQRPITVFNAVESIEITVPEKTLYAVSGLNTLALGATVLPEDATDKTLVWSVSDSTVAAIDPTTGELTALKPGEITVTAVAADARGMRANYSLTVQPRDLSEMDAPEIEDIAYTGSPIVPEPVLVMDDLTLVPGTDYTLTVPEATTVGEYTLTVTGIGNYTGTLSLPFSIIKATPVITYTGKNAYRADAFVASFTVAPMRETAVSYALVSSDESTTPIDGVPSAAGLYDMTITVPGDDNYNASSLTVRIRLYTIDSIDLSCTQLPMFIGQSVRIAWTNKPDDEAIPELLWSTDNTNVVSVNENGQLLATGAGTATLTASLPTDESKSATCTVTVYGSGLSMNLPAALTRIEDEAFMNTAFSRVIMGEKVESIGQRAFFGANDLMQIYLPASIRTLSSDAFEGCPAVLLCAEGSAAAVFAAEHELPYVIY